VVTALESPARLEAPVNNRSQRFDQSIDDFLARPVLWSTVAWNISDIVNSKLISFAPQEIFLTEPYKSKLAGFGYIKATAVFKIQINASPMNAGALLVCHIPDCIARKKGMDARTSLTARSQLPSAVLDVQQSELVFEIPWSGPVSHFSFERKDYGYGDLAVFVYSLLSNGSSGSNQVNINIWASFKDVDLMCPIVPQAGSIPKRGNFKARASHPSEQELGPVSQTLRAVSVMATSLSAIPTLTALAGPVAWFTNIAAGVASSFGWSKPMDDATGGRVIQGVHFSSQNTNGVDHSQQLGVFSDNKIRVMADLGATVEDEMSINFIKKQFAFNNRFTLSTSNSTGDVVYSTPIGPRYLNDNLISRNASGTTFFTGSLLTVSFLSRLFRHFRGGLCFRFRIIKTPLHNARLSVSFKPTRNTTVIPPSLVKLFICTVQL